MIYYKYDTSGQFVETVESDYRPAFCTAVAPLDGQLYNSAKGKWEYPYEPTLAEVAEITARNETKEKKAKIASDLEVLTVTTTNGNTFDATNQARLDMSNGISASEFLGQTQAVWRLADDSEVLIQLAELKEALALAIQEYAKIKKIGV